ncbi:MAG: Crp/Fnr family transcriptional regulator [Bryobacteraceae bacterium]|nr:Crp/Fnr family transcriptional regulator [Bryobacteraceae bacterium]
MSTPTPLQRAIEDLLVRERQVEILPATVREFYRAGDPAGSIFYARTGMVKLSEDHGAEGLTLELVGPGEVFGGESLLGAAAYRGSAIRLAAGEIVRIPAALFPRLAARRQELWQGVARQMEDRLRLEQRKFRWLVRSGAEERIGAMLEYLAPNCPLMARSGADEAWHGVPLTQAELAVLVGASRETTSSVLNEMERRGELSLRRGRILMPAARAHAAHAG